MAVRAKLLFLSIIYIVLLNFVHSSELTNLLDENFLTEKAYVFWPNATIPFFIDGETFDKEQQLSILTALTLFAFKTCLKFAPVMARPQSNEHVLVLENPTGVRKCTINTEPHSIEEPHRVVLGYDCLKSPNIDMMIMKALGFPFEHNRAIRDLYVEVQTENVEPGYLELFNRDLRLPMELRSIPYDPNSVMHFGEREFSSNGHRTIIFKNRSFRQERFGLSSLDLRKIDVVYGPECLKRDRAEKVELCQNYPGVARRKRDTNSSQSLRVNPDITPPPAVSENAANESLLDKLVNDLAIEKEVEDIVARIQKINLVALTNARTKLCSNNDTKKALRTLASDPAVKPKVLDIIEEIVYNAKDLVALASKNLTEFCSEAKPIEGYQRSSCPFFDKDRCAKNYHSTKSGRVKYSTQHRPFIPRSTATAHTGKRNVYVNWFRSRNDTDEQKETSDAPVSSPATVSKRRKREVASTNSNATVTTNLPKASSVASDILRMGTKLLPKLKKDIYLPNYRASNPDGADKEKVKNKREAPAGGGKSKIKKHRMLKSDDARRRFESQRFRSKKELADKEEYERGKKEREWDNSGISGERERISHKNADYEHPAERHLRVRQKQRLYAQQEKHEGRPRNKEEAPEEQTAPTPSKKTRLRSRPDSHPKQKHEASVKETRVKEVDEKYPMDQGPGLGSRISQEDDHDETERPAPKKRPPAHENEPSLQEKESPAEEKESTAQEKEESVRYREPATSEEPPAGKPRVDSQTRGRWKPRGAETTEHVVETRIVEKISIPSKQEVKFKSHQTRGDSMSVLPRVVELSKKNKEFYDERKWPDGVVRYVLKDPSDGEADIADVRQRLDEVNEILKRRTCARLEEISEEEADSYEDYLVLDSSPDYVTGRVGGKQNFGVIELLKGGQHRQHAAMMVMAMLGFYFEIARHDRDEYIRVHMRHVRPDKLHHFEKIREDATFPLPYDYKSATHPAWQFWRQLGKTGISTVATFKETDSDGSIMKSLGQNHQLLSELDIVKINSVYGIDCFMKNPPQQSDKQKEEPAEEEPKTEDPYEEYKGSKQRIKKRKPGRTEGYAAVNYGKREKKKERPVLIRDKQRKNKVIHEEYKDDYKEESDVKWKRDDLNTEREDINNAKRKIKHEENNEEYREQEIISAKRKKKGEAREYDNRGDGREESFPRKLRRY